MTGPAESLSIRLARVNSTLSGAEAVLELIGDYGQHPITQNGAIYGAATIVREAIRQLTAIELSIADAGTAA